MDKPIRLDQWPPQGLVKLYTLQGPEPVEALRRHGVMYGPDVSQMPESDDPQSPIGVCLKDSYAWMRAQMQHRLPHFSGHYPLWAWPRRSNLRQLRKVSPANSFWITARVPVSRILASDYMAWHSILNQGAITKTEEEWDAFYPTIGPHLPLDLAQATWPLVFDLKACQSLWGETSPKSHVQLCVDGLYAQDILSIKPLKGCL